MAGSVAGYREVKLGQFLYAHHLLVLPVFLVIPESLESTVLIWISWVAFLVINEPPKLSG